MTPSSKAPNRLIEEKSPYLLQHAGNPVDWYPWGNEAFEKAKVENKPVFLSIGYSTCHWCHVMAHECFEDAEVADILNRNFVSIKVDKEERPDIDGIYMNVCIELTGSGGWPMTIVMDHSGKPFFAGTYFPKRSRYGMPGLIELLKALSGEWETNRKELLDSAERIIERLYSRPKGTTKISDSNQLIELGIGYFKASFDRRYGGFGRAPKFPTPHNLLFLLEAYKSLGNKDCLEMAEKTLLSMAKGGIFDHIGYGFSRYSTDEKWLAPHFEKMLYDNALLIMAYTKAYAVTRDPVYKTVAEKTILYIEREMTHPGGGFYSAQDADSGGVEGKYYVFTPQEVVSILGKPEGQAFCELYDITEAGNFEGKSIPNQIGRTELDDSMSPLLSGLYEYRKQRAALHKDDKILTAWNGLMIAALADASVAFEEESYLQMAERAVEFIDMNLCADGRIAASFRDGRRTDHGFLDDYAFYIYALLRVYNATRESRYLERAKSWISKVIADFHDDKDGGFYFTGEDSVLVARLKETYDGAIPSGNSVMVMNLLYLDLLTGEYGDILDKQIDFMTAAAADVPGGYGFFLYSLLKKQSAKRAPGDFVCDKNGCRVVFSEGLD